MCILINHPAGTNFSDELLHDFFDHNSDGFGAMYAEHGKIVVIKTLGSSEEIIKLYRDTLADKECVIHYRMKTHGDIDMENCHPYHVTDDVWMAHNGILSFGNPIDKTKSDTWHFIKYILRPIIKHNKYILLDPEFQRYIATMIGSSNKLAFVLNTGETVIINESAGVQHKGAWLSNTYAWSAHKHMRTAKTYTSNTYYPTSVWGTKYDRYDEDAAYEDAMYYDMPVRETKPQNFSYKKVERAAYNSYMRGRAHLIDWVCTAPAKAVYFLTEWFGDTYKDDHLNERIDIIVYSDPDYAADMITEIFEDVGNTAVN